MFPAKSKTFGTGSGTTPAGAAASRAELRSIDTNNQVRGFEASQKSVSRLFGLLDNYPARAIPPGDLSVAFLDDAAMSSLHEKFLGDPSPTDVITFPGEQEPGDPAPFAGEICVCVPQARREAPLHNNRVQDELLLYLVHGWLHLSGLDDISDEDRLLMRAAEREALGWLRTAGFKPGWGA